MALGGQDVVRRALEGNANIVEVEVEYRKGKKAKFDLLPGNSPSRQAQIDRLLESVKWGKVEEVEMEYADGYKEEIDLEAEVDEPKTTEAIEEAVVDPIAASVVETASQADIPAEEPAAVGAQEETAHPPIEIAPNAVPAALPTIQLADSAAPAAPARPGSRRRGRKPLPKSRARRTKRTGVVAAKKVWRNKAVTTTRANVHSFKSVLPLVTVKKPKTNGGSRRIPSRVTLFI